MITTLALAILTAFQADNELWPPGYFDIVGEMSYKEAADAIGVKPPNPTWSETELLTNLKKDFRNVVLWKAAADKCIAENKWQEYYDFCIQYGGWRRNQSKSEFTAVINSVGYSMYSIKQHFNESRNHLNPDLSKKWNDLLNRTVGIHGGLRVDKSEILAQLTSRRGSPKEWRELLASYEGKISCGYYIHYSRAESYMFGELPVDEHGKPIGQATPMDLNKCAQEYRKTHELYPTKPTPCYKLAALLQPKDPASAKVFARKYLALENRSFKTRWKTRMSSLAK